MREGTLRNPAGLPSRLDLIKPRNLLLVDVPDSLTDLLSTARASGSTRTAPGRSIRAVKESFDAILVWREDRVGSRSFFDSLIKRLELRGTLWAVTALKKVKGPETPAVHRLEAGDLDKAFRAAGLSRDRELRVTAWHVAYRFVRR